MNVLERLAGYARERVEAAKADKPLAQIREEAMALPKGDFAFEQALRKKKLSRYAIRPKPQTAQR